MVLWVITFRKWYVDMINIDCENKTLIVLYKDKKP